MDEQVFLDIIALITKHTGIIPRESHKEGIKNFIEKRTGELGLHSMIEYKTYLVQNPNEFCSFINGATVNETYFFREEAQFSLLKEKIFPALRISTKGATLRLWSAAASSGEEIYSLYLLASAMGLSTECIASDINTDVLEKCAKGAYNANSLRTVDGAQFRYLLAPYQKDESTVIFPESITKKIERRQINLAKREAIFPKNVHVIFLRNVFVYFTLEMRRAILEKIVNESLAEGGYLFVSRSETATIDRTIIPKNLKKCSDGNIFYFQKVTGEG